MMQEIDYEIKVYDNCIEIIPKEGMKDNSIYNINIKDIKALYSNSYISEEIEIYTKMTPSYSSVFSVKSLIESYDVEDKIILFHIKEASRFVNYVLKVKNIEDEELKYKAEQYTKYKTAHECVLRLYIEKTTVLGTKGSLGDVSFDNQGNYDDISKLLAYLKKEAINWEDALRGYDLEGRARPVTAMRGSKAAPMMTNLSLGYSRGV